MEYEPEKIQVALWDGFEEISRDSGTPPREPQRDRGSLRSRDMFWPIRDDSVQTRIHLHQAVEQGAGGTSDIHGHEVLRRVKALSDFRRQRIGNTNDLRP